MVKQMGYIQEAEDYDPNTDQTIYNTIGVMTTLPVRGDDEIPERNPIGFVW